MDLAAGVGSSYGFCCNVLTLVVSPLREGSAHLLRGNLEQSGDELLLGLDVVAADVPNLPFPDHGHRLAPLSACSVG